MRSHVVFKLLCALMDSKYRLGPFLHNGVALKRKFGELAEKRYPSTELHLPEHERDGVIPEADAEAMRQAVQPCPGDRTSGVKQKHATSVALKQDITVMLIEIRPSATFDDRVNSHCVARCSRTVGVAQALPLQCQH